MGSFCSESTHQVSAFGVLKDQTPSELEQKVQMTEKGLNLSRLDYKMYEANIKSFGYRVRINDNCWKLVENETKIYVTNFSKKLSVQGGWFRHPDIYDAGRYDSYKLLLIGFLHCEHQDSEMAERAIWGIVNPFMKEKVDHKEVEKFLKTLCEIAIEIPKDHYKVKLTAMGSHHDDHDKKEAKDTPQIIGCKEVYKYLTECHNGVDEHLELLMAKLGHDEIDKDRFFRNVGDKWISAFAVRSLMNRRGALVI